MSKLKVQMNSKALMSNTYVKKLFALSHLDFIWHLDFDL